MSRATVFIWPLMSQAEKEARELEIIYAGYEAKRMVRVRGHDIWGCK